jgi:tRNA threonylcarbamoyladenosine biosynthesis protein TsaE
MDETAFVRGAVAEATDRTMHDPSAAGATASGSAEQTRAIGRRLGRAVQPGTFIALIGPLGAGKTELTKGIAEGLGIRNVVNSPTFVLMNEHVGRLRLFHIDAYRLGDPDEAFAAGLLDERQAEGVTVAEWADRLQGWLPEERLEIEIDPDPKAAERRTLRWAARGERAARLAREALTTAGGKSVQPPRS